MNKEEIEKAKENVKNQNAEEVKDDLRTLHKILWNEHREGTYTVEKTLKYISELELEVKSYKMTHKYDVNMIDEVKENAVKWSKERDNLESILDKVTDKLKEICNKYIKEYKNVEKLDLIGGNTAVLQELSCVIDDIEEILNIIESK